MARIVWGLLCLSLAVALLGGPARADDWKDIDCASSKLKAGIGAGVSCKRGPDLSEGAGGCLAQRFVASSQAQGFAVQLETLVGLHCFFQDPLNLANEVKYAFSWGGFVHGWSNLKDLAGAAGAYMTVDGNRCFSFYEPGPTRSEGYAYVLHGYYCARDDQLDDSTVSAFLRTIKVDQ